MSVMQSFLWADGTKISTMDGAYKWSMDLMNDARGSISASMHQVKVKKTKKPLSMELLIFKTQVMTWLSFWALVTTSDRSPDQPNCTRPEELLFRTRDSNETYYQAPYNWKSSLEWPFVYTQTCIQKRLICCFRKGRCTDLWKKRRGRLI